MTESKDLNTTALAYMGDAVYEIYVREHLLERGSTHTDILQKEAVSYVSAGAQAGIIKILMEGELSDEELSLVKRARNHKASSSKKTKASRKGADIITDKLSTAFEALLGKLYLDGDTERLENIINRSFELIESEARE